MIAIPEDAWPAPGSPGERFRKTVQEATDPLIGLLPGGGLKASVVFDQCQLVGSLIDTSQGMHGVLVTVSGVAFIVPLYPLSATNAPGLKGVCYDLSKPLAGQPFNVPQP